jgi:uncharacterized protein
MPRDVLEKGVRMAFAAGNKARISFFGGEPLLEKGLIRQAVSLARTIEKSGQSSLPLSFSTTVNGTLLDDETLDYFSKEKFHLVVSLDGSRQAHDATRRDLQGRSSYDRIATNLKNALKTIPSTETISVIDVSNVDYLSESFDALLDLGVKNLNFSFNYEADWNDKAMEVLEAQLGEISKRYLELYRSGRDIHFDLFDSKIITHLKEGYSCRDRCRFGDGEITVAPSGRLYPCERLVAEDDNDEVCIGHVDTGVDMGKVLEMARQKNTPDADCQACGYQNRCMFWCGCVNYATTGRVGETSGVLCALEQLAIQYADKVAGTLFEEKNTPFLRKFYPMR